MNPLQAEIQALYSSIKKHDTKQLQQLPGTDRFGNRSKDDHRNDYYTWLFGAKYWTNQQLQKEPQHLSHIPPARGQFRSPSPRPIRSSFVHNGDVLVHCGRSSCESKKSLLGGQKRRFSVPVEP
ncbi:unnamed protein product [Cuscuta epithymum]|uniref:Uncharacterized protein n=1 Tax=Cuscuta epithymum TaxID=186058 RepID=A0AAV0D7Y0_9ASTE|nr:unnamed protein product [Cuscuta epithymum]